MRCQERLFSWWGIFVFIWKHSCKTRSYLIVPFKKIYYFLLLCPLLYNQEKNLKCFPKQCINSLIQLRKQKKVQGTTVWELKTLINYWPGFAILFLTATGSFLFHFWSSSCILSILAGFRAHKQPFREELPDLFSTFSKHLFKDKLCRTEFFQPSGAVWKNKSNLRMELPGKKKIQIYFSVLIEIIIKAV